MLEKLKYESKRILLKTGDFLKTDIRYIVKQGSWLVGGEFINNILSVALTVAFANLISVTSYGTYKYILSIYGIFALFGLSGANAAVIKSVAEGNEGIFKPALKSQIKWGFMGSICLIFVAFYYLIHGNNLFGYGFIIAAVALPFFESLNTYQHVLAGKKRFDLQTKYYSSTRITSSLSIILTLCFSDNILLILVAYFTPYILANIIFGHLALKNLELNEKFNPEAITYMKHLSFIRVLSSGVNYLESIIIFQFLGPIQLAIFSIASAPMARLQSFFSIIPDLSLPKYVQRSIKEIKETIFAKIWKSSGICILIVVIYLIIIPIFFKLFLPQYLESIKYSRLLAIPLIWYPIAILARILVIKATTKQLYQYYVVESVAQLLIMFFAIYFFGLMGAVIGTISVSIIGNIILYYFFTKLE